LHALLQVKDLAPSLCVAIVQRYTVCVRAHALL